MGTGELNKQFTQRQVASIVAWRDEMQWLADAGASGEQVALFGAGTGEALLALMWTVGGMEGMGLDANPENVTEAGARTRQLQYELQRIWNRLSVSDSLPQEEFIWWNDQVPDFLKETLLGENFIIEFQQGMLPERSPLAFEHYDIVYADFVLHDILLDKSRQATDDDMRLSAGKLARSVRPGGYVAVMDWVQYQFHPRMDYQLWLEQVGLLTVYTKEVRVDNWHGKGYAGVYLCKKTQG